MRRSKQHNTEEVAHPSNLSDARIDASAVSAADLLRILKLPPPPAGSPTVVFHRLSLHRAARKTRGVDQYALLRLCDALMETPDTGATTRLDDAEWHLGINSYTLDTVHDAINNISFFSDIAMVKDPMTALLSKVLNSRCQGRKYGTVAEQDLLPTPLQTKRYETIQAIWHAMSEESPPTKPTDQREIKFVEDYRAIHTRRQTFRQILLCSLLGNYPHCTTRITHPHARRMLYQLVSPSSDTLPFFQSMLHADKAMLVVWCVRDFLVHCILDDPAMQHQVGELIHFKSLHRLTDRAMGVARAYMEDSLAIPSSSLCQALRPAAPAALPQMCECLTKKKKSGPCLYKDISWLRDTTVLLAPFHGQMLDIQFHKPKIDAVQWLVSKEARTTAPLVPRRLSQEEEDAKERAANRYDSDQERDEDEFSADVLNKLGTTMRLANGGRFIAKLLNLRDCVRKEKEADAIDKSVSNNPHVYVTPVQCQALHKLLVIYDRDLCKIVESWRDLHFGVEGEEIDYILTLLDYHRSSDVAKSIRKHMLVELSQRAPHAYNLLQVTAEFIKQQGPDGDEGRVVGYFSIETVRAQVAASHKKVVGMLQHLQRCKESAIRKLKDGCGALDITDALKECQDEMDRIAADADSRGHALVEKAAVSLHFCPICSTIYSNVRMKYNPLVSKYYRYGLRRATLKYGGTGGTYCNNNVVNHKGSCHQQLLQSVNLLGLRYAFGKRVYQLCVRCADIMSPQGEPVYCEDGMLCCQCAREQKTAQEVDPAEAFVTGLDRRCVCCATITTTNESTFLYPFGLCLCRHHGKPYITRHVLSKEWKDKNDLKQGIAKYFCEVKLRKQRRAQPGNTRIMKAARQRHRNQKA